MKILILEDHSVYRDGIRNLLQQMEEPCELLEAGTGQEGITLVSQHPDLDLVLIDLTLPDMNGFAVMAEFQNLQASLPMIILSASDDLTDMKKALDGGAVGFITKSTSAEVILSAINLVLSGGIYVPPEMFKQYSLKHGNDDINSLLTHRQKDVLELLLDGQCNKDIARTLNLSLATVKAHMGAIFKALHVHNRTQAAVAAQRLGLQEKFKPS